MKSTESDVCYFEVDAVFNREPVELLEENTWTAGLRKTGNDTGKEVLCFLEFGDVFFTDWSGLHRRTDCRTWPTSSMGFDWSSRSLTR